MRFSYTRRITRCSVSVGHGGPSGLSLVLCIAWIWFGHVYTPFLFFYCTYITTSCSACSVAFHYLSKISGIEMAKYIKEMTMSKANLARGLSGSDYT